MGPPPVVLTKMGERARKIKGENPVAYRCKITSPLTYFPRPFLIWGNTICFWDWGRTLLFLPQLLHQATSTIFNYCEWARNPPATDPTWSDSATEGEVDIKDICVRDGARSAPGHRTIYWYTVRASFYWERSRKHTSTPDHPQTRGKIWLLRLDLWWVKRYQDSW